MISLTSPVQTRAHGWPAGAKLLALALTTVVLFSLKTVVAQALALVGILGLFVLGGRQFFLSGLNRIKVIWPFVLIMLIWHGWTQDWAGGLVIVLRMITALGLATLVTMTSRLDDMLDVAKWLVRPFAPLGLSPERVGLAAAMVIRFTPVLADKGQKLSQAWQARSCRRASWRIVTPFLAIALDDADHVADALRARGVD